MKPGRSIIKKQATATKTGSFVIETRVPRLIADEKRRFSLIVIRRRRLADGSIVRTIELPLDELNRVARISIEYHASCASRIDTVEVR